MNRRTIFFFSFFMGLVLLGLIVVQLFWISSAIKLTEQRFEQEVNDALNDVVTRFEKLSTFSKLTQKFNFRKQAVRWLSPKSDTVNKRVAKIIGDTNKERRSYKVAANKPQFNVKVYEETTSDSNGVVTNKI